MIGLIYSIGSYSLFLATFIYFAVFSDGRIVPKTVDTGVPASAPVAVAIDLLLILLFGLQHSVMARPGWKRFLTRVIPPALERSTYVLASTLALILLMWQWRPMPAVIWHIDNVFVASTLWSINALGWLGVPACSFLIDHWDLFGLKPALRAFRHRTIDKTADRSGFVTPLVYKYLRHPMMTSLLVALWLTPYMTAGHLLLSIGMSVYVVIGVHFEERSLVKDLGAEYLHYQATTPMFLPFGSSGRARR